MTVPNLESFDELQTFLRLDIWAISRGLQSAWRQALRAKISVQIWFSAGNILVLYHRLPAVWGRQK